MICKLCNNEKKLCDSHIIPEFFYKYMYDSGHRVFAIPGDSNKKIGILQKGITEKLLCVNCEDHINTYETYTKELFFDGNPSIQKIVNNEEYFVITGIDYDKFKLFQLSVLWRASICSNSFFKEVSLGRHEDFIRNMIFEKTPGYYFEYGCMMSTLEDKGELFDAIRKPDQIRMEGHITYRFIMGGFLWDFIVSNHARTFPFKNGFLQENRQFAIMKSKPQDFPFLIREAKALKGKQSDMMKLIQRYNIDLSKL